MTPLHYACQERYWFVAKCLIEHGASLSAEDIKKIVPAEIIEKNCDVFDYLKKDLVNINEALASFGKAHRLNQMSAV